MLYSVSQTLEVVVEEMEWLAVYGSFPVNLILLVEVENFTQLLTSVEVEDPVQFS